MLIESEVTFNTNVRNFYFNTPFLKIGQMEYANQMTVQPSQLLKNILDLQNIKEVLLTPDMLFVQKENNGDWSVLAPQIMAEVVEYDFSNFENFDFSTQNIPAAINALIEAKIRPFLIRDGGNIELIDFKNGVLFVKLQGKCHGCPHVMQTLKNTIEATLKKYIPAVRSVQREGQNV